MSWDTLLYWMSHLGEGSWAAFHDAVERLVPDGDSDAVARTLRIRLSDLGYADFFIGGSQHWRVVPPVLAGLSGLQGRGMVCGARTRALLASLEAAATSTGCHLEVRPAMDGPSDLMIEGSVEVVSNTAALAGIPYVPDYAMAVMRDVKPIPALYDAASLQEAPLGWRVVCFDIRALRWIETLLPNSACEYASKYGVRRHFVSDVQLRLREIGRREAVFASAWLSGVRLASYSAQEEELTTPIETPLPALCARAACLCSGEPARLSSGRLRYSSVPLSVAGPLLLLVGQPHPGFKLVTATLGE